MSLYLIPADDRRVEKGPRSIDGCRDIQSGAGSIRCITGSQMFAAITSVAGNGGDKRITSRQAVGHPHTGSRRRAVVGGGNGEDDILPNIGRGVIHGFDHRQVGDFWHGSHGGDVVFRIGVYDIATYRRRVGIDAKDFDYRTNF